MPDRAVDTWRRRRYAYTLSFAGIALYNNWLLATVLNPHAMLAGATTSELGATDQPWAWLFCLLEALAAVCFLAGMAAVASLGKQKWMRVGLRAGVITLGGSTLIESIARLNCSSALEAVCAQNERLHTVSWQHNFHIAESVLAYGLMAILPIMGFFAARAQPHARRLRLFSLALLLYMILWAIEGTVLYYHNATRYGYEQRLFIILFSAWYWQVIRTTWVGSR